ncbi:MAG TPA: peptide ABC transporter substrate-binding protein [Candidatus Saccharimonas sp.]|nr:peptide ABC transporter substrate-binding protein [Candidatus Saccharimonas sp.]
MDDDKVGWKKFKRIQLDRKQLLRRAKKMEGATQRHAHRFVIRRLDNIKSVSREITTWLLLVSAIIVGIGVQLYWGQAGYMTDAAARGGTYVEGVVGSIETLNPLFASTNSEASLSRLMFSSLYNYDETGSLHQDLATGMKIDETNKIYTVTIRDNVKWHDNTPLTARDIAFTLELVKNPAVRSPLRVNWLDVSVKAVDNKTVQFILPATYAAFPYALTFPVLPEHLLKDIAPGAVRESAYSQSPVGSGPFRFRLLQQPDVVSQHKVVHLVANSKYYAGAPKLSRFEIHAYQNGAAMIKALKSGELSGASDVSPLHLSEVDLSHYDRTAAAQDNGVYLLLNQNNPLLKEQAVRKALQVGTDAGAVRQAIGGDQLALDLPLLNTHLTGADIPHAPLFDQTRAKGMLDEAGWKAVGEHREKDGKKLEITITSIKDSEYEKAVETVEKQWRQLGIVTHHRIIDTSGAASTFVQDVLQTRNFEVLLYELAIGADPDVYAYWHSSQIGQTGYNFTSYTNKTVDANLASARSRLEPELRNAKYKQFVKQWIEDVPAIGLYQPVMEYVTNDNVSALGQNSVLVNAADRYANVQYWTVANTSVYKTP